MARKNFGIILDAPLVFFQTHILCNIDKKICYVSARHTSKNLQVIYHSLGALHKK